MTFAAIDWSMSLSPHWASTIYGFLFVAGQAISAMSLMIIMVILFSHAEPFATSSKKGICTTSETVVRVQHAVGVFLVFAVADHLVRQPAGRDYVLQVAASSADGAQLPRWCSCCTSSSRFRVVVARRETQSGGSAQDCDVADCNAVPGSFWLTRPEFTSRALPTLWDFAAVLALGGIWLWFFAVQLKQQPLLPLGEPKLAEAIANHEH